MKQLKFDYRMQIRYSEPVSICHFKIKCLPAETLRQHLLSASVEFIPEFSYSEGLDSFGNRQFYGTAAGAHDSFCFHISGEVEIGQLLCEEPENESLTPLFRHSSGLNRPGNAIYAYYEMIKNGLPTDIYKRSLALMHCLYRDFFYQPGCTDTDTSAEEAFLIGKGVCQDYVHIYLSLLHLSGIPARYVTGMIVGEGATHAWAEVLYHHRWIGIDPTNDLTVNESYIKLGHGRDARDCLINRGVMKGGGLQTQEIRVKVWDSVSEDVRPGPGKAF